MKKLLAVLASACALSGCAVGPVQVRSPFDAAQTAAMLRPGPNTITGSALLRQVNGGVVTCAGFPVVMFPATEYAKERIHGLYGDSTFRSIYAPRREIIPDPPEFTASVRQATCNAQGFFRFDNVADGDFFLLSMVTWGTPPYGVKTGGAVLGRAHVQGGQAVEVTLTSQ